MTRICMVGSGAVGGYVGAHAAKAGIDTVFVDAWPAHVEAMRSNGLTVSGMPDTETLQLPVRALHISDVPQLMREKPIDIAFIAVKSYDTLWASQLILPYLAPGGCLVSLQNGINEDAIASVAGWEKTLGCAVSALAAELVAPGCIVRTSPWGSEKQAGMRIGEVHGRHTPRAEHVAAILAHGDTSKVTGNLWGERWSKLAINAMRNGICAMTGFSGKERDSHDLARRLSIRLGSTSVRIGRAQGLALEPVGGLDLDLLERAESDPGAMEAITQMIQAVANSRSDTQRPSMAQDIRKGRRTEIDGINGLVAMRGEALGLDVRLHRRLSDIMHRIERGEATPAPALLQTFDDCL